MIPAQAGGKDLSWIKSGGNPVSFTVETIKGYDYALFTASNGSYTASYEPDTIAPTIVSHVPVTNATNVTVTSNAMVTFNEAMDAGTINGSTFSLRASGAGSDVASAVTYDALTMIATLNPNIDLGYSTLYTATVSGSVTDLANNPLGSNHNWSFTTQSILLPSVTDTTVADFAAGTLGTCVADATIGDGALRLLLTTDEDFSGTALPSGWTSTAWTGGTSTVSGGAVAVDGARLTPTSITGSAPTALVPVVMEFMATFGAAGFQNAGLGAGDNTTVASGMYASADQPWATFGTAGTTNTLYTRLNPDGDVAIGNSANLIGSSHRYRIEWRSGNVVEFFIDGVSVDIRTASFGTITMRPGISDYNSGGPNLTVDWLRLTPYISPCTFTSHVLDAGTPVDWLDLTSAGSSPTGTSVTFQTHTGNVASPDGSWSVWEAVNSPIASPNGRYIQYRAALSTTAPAQSPVVESVSLTYEAIPQYTLTVTSAHGTVAKNPDTATYTYGTVVTLTATASPGWTFASWTGDATGATSPVTVTMNANRAVTANYTRIRTP